MFQADITVTTQYFWQFTTEYFSIGPHIASLECEVWLRNGPARKSSVRPSCARDRKFVFFVILTARSFSAGIARC
jgi:hypothetical protein